MEGVRHQARSGGDEGMGELGQLEGRGKVRRVDDGEERKEDCVMCMKSVRYCMFDMLNTRRIYLGLSRISAGLMGSCELMKSKSNPNLGTTTRY